jgi:hypothetical protein
VQPADLGEGSLRLNVDFYYASLIPICLAENKTEKMELAEVRNCIFFQARPPSSSPPKQLGLENGNLNSQQKKY